MSQLSSFGTAFLTVFAVIFVVFRSARFGVLGIIANALPVCAVLGLMGWLGISLNVATVMVASVALGIVDDDTIHFIGRFRREAAAGASSAEAIEMATMHEGRASLTTAIINSLGYGVMLIVVLQADRLVRRTAGADDGGGVPGRGVRGARRDHAVAAHVRRRAVRRPATQLTAAAA